VGHDVISQAKEAEVAARIMRLKEAAMISAVQFSGGSSSQINRFFVKDPKEVRAGEPSGTGSSFYSI
jgi:hypothetical protein